MKYITSFAISVLVAAVALSVFPTVAEAEIYDSVVRLHVIANSDSERDQSLKLLVRDAVLEYTAERMSKCTSSEEAAVTIREMKEELETVAEDCLRANGEDDCVSVEFGREKYPRREYDGVTLPAGEYNSLRIVIGNGAGKNWWCVIFPSICVRFAGNVKEDYISAGFTPDEYRVITGNEGKMKVKFRILEIFASLFD